MSNITLPRAAEQVRKALELALESQFTPDDVECEHGMHYRDCSNNVCVMRDCKAALAALDAALAEPPAKREFATDEQIIASWPTELPYLPTPHAFYKGFRAAERFHGIRGSK